MVRSLADRTFQLRRRRAAAALDAAALVSCAGGPAEDREVGRAGVAHRPASGGQRRRAASGHGHRLG